MPIDFLDLIADQTPATEADPRRELVNRIAVSPHFRSAIRLRDLLLYIADGSFRDDLDSLTEQQIGIHVFGRDPGYNCSEDSVVRTQARQLRLKLDAYFASDGRKERLIVWVPKGHYVLAFDTKETAGVDSLEIRPARHTEPNLINASEANAELPSSTRSGLQWNWMLLTVLLGLLLAFSSGVILTSLLHRFDVFSPRSEGVSNIWTPFLGAEQPLVIYSNALFVGNATSGLRYFSEKDSPNSIHDTYTGVGEVAAVHDLDQLFDGQRKTFILKRSHLVTWDEARTKSLIFIGSSEENLSLAVIPTTRDFTFITPSLDDPGGQSGIVNHHPLPGEQARYIVPPGSPVGKDYALIALVPGLTARTWILVLAGTNTYGTQAAADFATSKEGALEITQALHATGAQMKPFEAILEVDVGGGVPIHTRLLGVHPR